MVDRVHTQRGPRDRALGPAFCRPALMLRVSKMLDADRQLVLVSNPIATTCGCG